jgi:predicted Zn-dependent peptidase
MILFVVGDLDPGELFSFVAEKSRFASAPQAPGGPPVTRLYPDEPRAVFRRETRKEMEVALPKLLLGFKEVGAPDHGEEFVLDELASELALEILFGKSSDTFRELYEAQLVLDDFGASYSLGAGVGYGVVGGDTPRPDDLRDEVLGRLSRLIEGGIDPGDFERGKRRFIGSFIRAFNSLEYIAGHYSFYRFHGFDLFRGLDLLQRIDREALERKARALLDPENYASYIITPKTGTS